MSHFLATEVLYITSVQDSQYWQSDFSLLSYQKNTVIPDSLAMVALDGCVRVGVLKMIYNICIDIYIWTRPTCSPSQPIPAHLRSPVVGGVVEKSLICIPKHKTQECLFYNFNKIRRIYYLQHIFSLL